MVLIAILLAVILPVAQSEVKTLTVKSGGQIHLQSGLSGPMGVLQFHWSFGTGQEPETLIDVDEGKVDRNPPERFAGRLFQDTMTGSVNISSANVLDSGIYNGWITAENNIIYTVNYNVTVLDADLMKPSAGPPHDPTDHKRSHLILVLVCLAVAVFIVVVCIVLLFKKKYTKVYSNQDIPV